jgi:hypothetical protein
MFVWHGCCYVRVRPRSLYLTRAHIQTLLTRMVSTPGMETKLRNGIRETNGLSLTKSIHSLRGHKPLTLHRSLLRAYCQVGRRESISFRARNGELGFGIVQVLIVLAVAAIVVTFAVMGIASARAHVRLSNSARQFASYAERARANAVQRHDATSVQQVDERTYSVTMDFSGSGIVTTQNFSTETGVTLNMPRTITFDWRGRTPVETSVGFTNESGTTNVDVTGSGDITIDSEIFHDGSIPTVGLNGAGGTVLPDSTPVAGASPSASPSPSTSPTPPGSPDASPTPPPDPDATPIPSPDPTATPTPSPTPVPTGTPPPTPTPMLCSIVGPSSIDIPQNGSGTVSVNLNNSSGSVTITATSGNSGQIQVAPTSATVTGSDLASFTITVKKVSGSVTISSPCGSKEVTVTVP